MSPIVHEIPEEYSKLVKTDVSSPKPAPNDRLSNYCPECFKQTLVQADEGQVCEVCGVVVSSQGLRVDPYSRAPSNELLWGRNIGTSPEYGELRKTGVVFSAPKILNSQMEPSIEADFFTRKALEELMLQLKPLDLDPRSTNDLGRLLRFNIGEWKAKNPLLKPNYKVRRQIVAQTLARGELHMPRLKGIWKKYLRSTESNRRG